MRRLLVKARTRVGVAVIGAAVLAGAGSATAAVLVQPASSTAPDDGQVFEAPAAETTETAAPETAAPEAEPEPADTPAPTVQAVTEPEPATAPVVDEEPASVSEEPQVTTPPAPGSYDPEAPFTDDAGLTYLPAPDAPAEPLPGEPGYVPPGG